MKNNIIIYTILILYIHSGLFAEIIKKTGNVGVQKIGEVKEQEVKKISNGRFRIIEVDATNQNDFAINENIGKWIAIASKDIDQSFINKLMNDDNMTINFIKDFDIRIPLIIKKEKITSVYDLIGNGVRQAILSNFFYQKDQRNQKHIERLSEYKKIIFGIKVDKEANFTTNKDDRKMKYGIFATKNNNIKGEAQIIFLDIIDLGESISSFETEVEKILSDYSSYTIPSNKIKKKEEELGKKEEELRDLEYKLTKTSKFNVLKRKKIKNNISKLISDIDLIKKQIRSFQVDIDNIVNKNKNDNDSDVLKDINPNDLNRFIMNFASNYHKGLFQQHLQTARRNLEVLTKSQSNDFLDKYLGLFFKEEVINDRKMIHYLSNQQESLTSQFNRMILSI